MAKKHIVFYDVLKFIAIATMVIDHIGYYFFPHFELARVIGRVAAPTFFFLVGYSKSTKISMTLLAYATLLQMLHFVITPAFQPLNVLFTISILRFTNRFFTKIHPIILFVIAIIAVYYSTIITAEYVEYGSIAILFAILGYYVREQKSFLLLYIFSLPTLILHIFTQQSFFHFYTHNLVIFAALLTIIMISYIYFYQINLKIIPKYPVLNNASIKLIAKYALIIYFLHKALFEVSTIVIDYITPPITSQYLQDEILTEKDLLTPYIK